MHFHVVRLVYLIDVPFGNKVLSISKILIHRIQCWIGDGKEAELEREVRRIESSSDLTTIIYIGIVGFDVLDDAG